MGRSLGGKAYGRKQNTPVPLNPAKPEPSASGSVSVSWSNGSSDTDTDADPDTGSLPFAL